MKSLILIFLLFAAGAGWGRAQTAAAVLTELETRYAEDRAASLRLVLARYADELEALQKKLLEAGDASGAARVQLERDRILPALGLPAVAEENADEFAAFEDSAQAPVLPATAAAPGDLDAILKTLLPQPPAPVETAAAGSAKPAPGTAVPVRNGRRLLKMANAQLIGSYDPVYGYYYWTAGRPASWILNDLPPGSYKLQLRYTCDDKEGGGKLQAKFGAAVLEAEVPPTGTWKRKRDLEIGPFEITESRAELVLKPLSVRDGAFYLMDLTAVLVLPVAPKTPP